jgi:hypothetical protein
VPFGSRIINLGFEAGLYNNLRLIELTVQWVTVRTHYLYIRKYINKFLNTTFVDLTFGCRVRKRNNIYHHIFLGHTWYTSKSTYHKLAVQGIRS